jgi:hypothetical protein
MMRTMTRTAATQSADWLAYFTRNRSDRMAIPWERGVQIDAQVARPLIHSLQRFQVGEQGDGRHLKQHAERTGDPTYSAAITLFVQEEQEHSRMLAELLWELNAQLIDSHWSDSAFILLRRLSGLHTEILILLIAEIIAKRYYRALAEGIGDPVAHTVFAQIVRDEQGHVAFHCDTLHQTFAPLPAVMRSAIRFGWHTIFQVACLIVMFDHWDVLRATQVASGAFWHDCNALFDEAADAIFGGT